MAVREYQCDTCGSVQELETPMTDPCFFYKDLFCTDCKELKSFARIYSAPHITAGMYTTKYTGQSAGVNGWGTHQLDYPSPKSDLIQGRAREMAQRINGHELNKGRPAA